MSFYNYDWFKRPENISVHLEKKLSFRTNAETDFWQKTHYEMRKDDGHFFYVNITAQAFEYEVSLDALQNARYDQAGIMLRSNAENWLKISAEYETAERSWVGAVNTKFGFSDWSTARTPTLQYQQYKLVVDGNNALVYALVATEWQQIRMLDISHLRRIDGFDIGVYACSPKGQGFDVSFFDVKLTVTRY